MIKDVEEFGPKLDVFGFSDAEILEYGEIPVRIARPNADVTARVTELLNRGVGVGDNLGEGGGVQPCSDSLRTGVWILAGDHIGPICREAGDFRGGALIGNIGGIKNGEGRATHGGEDTVELPPAECGLCDACGLAEERQTPLVAEDKAMSRVKQRWASFGSEVEGILRQIVFAGDGLCGGSGQVEGRGIVDSLRVCVGGEEGKSSAEALFQADFQRVVAGVRDAGD